MAQCHGNGSDHCCWINGKVCDYLEENTVEGRRWACGLFTRYGNWPEVHQSRLYLTDVKPLLAALGDFDCGDWPQDVLDLNNLQGAAVCCYG